MPLAWGAFTAAGANMAFNAELNRLFLVVMMGTLSGIGGGILRDVFVRGNSLCLSKGSVRTGFHCRSCRLFYTKPYLAGNGPLYVCFFVTVVIRGLSMKYDVHLPVVGVKKSSRRKRGEANHEIHSANESGRQHSAIFLIKSADCKTAANGKKYLDWH